MRETALVSIILAVAIAAASASYQYITTDASGTPVGASAMCPHCSVPAVPEFRDGQFVGEWKCSHCGKSFTP